MPVKKRPKKYSAKHDRGVLKDKVMQDIRKKNTKMKKRLEKMSKEIEALIEDLCHPPPGCDS